MHRVEQIVADIARKYGLRVKSLEGMVRLEDPNAPVFIEVRMTSSGVVVKLAYDDLGDYIRELVDTEEDPRSIVEELLDNMTAAAYEVSEHLRRNGFKTILDARTAALDIIEELEEALEEEEE